MTEFGLLLERFVVDQDREAYERIGDLFCRRSDALCAHAREHGIPASEVKDLVQSALIEASKERSLKWVWERYELDADDMKYLKMMLNNAISKWKKQRNVRAKRGREVHVSSYEQIVTVRDSGLGSDIAGGEFERLTGVTDIMPAERRRRFLRLRELIGDLDAEILRLRFCCQLPHNQIAAMIAMTHDTVRQRYHESCRRLRDRADRNELDELWELLSVMQASCKEQSATLAAAPPESGVPMTHPEIGLELSLKHNRRVLHLQGDATWRGALVHCRWDWYDRNQPDRNVPESLHAFVLMPDEGFLGVFEIEAELPEQVTFLPVLARIIPKYADPEIFAQQWRSAQVKPALDELRQWIEAHRSNFPPRHRAAWSRLPEQLTAE